MIEKMPKFIEIDSAEYSFRIDGINAIEKACYPKKWEEIKTIIDKEN